MLQVMHCNLTDGPSIVFDSCKIKGDTFIRGNGANTVHQSPVLTQTHCIYGAWVYLCKWENPGCIISTRRVIK